MSHAGIRPSLSRFLRLLREAPPTWVLGLFALMVFAGLTEGIGILLLVPMLEMLQDGQGGGNALISGLVGAMSSFGFPESAGGILSMFVMLMLVRSSVQYARERVSASLHHRVVDQLRQRCFAALLGVEWRWIAGSRQSDHANLLLTDVSRVGVGLKFGLGLLATLATMLTYLLAAFALSGPMTALALTGGGLVLLALGGQRRRAILLGQRLGVANRALQRDVQESLAGIKLAKILGNEDRHLASFVQTTCRLRHEQLRFAGSTSLAHALVQMGGAALLAGYLYAGLTVLRMPVPELLTLVLVFARLIPMFVAAQQQYHQWLHALPALLETDGLLAACAASAEPAGPDDGTPQVVTDSICLERVTVRHADRDCPALDEVSLCFPARTTTAVMGASGAGKSTLADVLMGLLAPDAGALRVDGLPLEGARRKHWRRAVAYVPQDVFLFNESIRNNLLWGRADASDAELLQALNRAAADFVLRLPQGLDSVVGDGGIRLSGGERQRLALARALLKQPALLILDEATSALDIESEARIRAAIEHLHGDLTVVIIGHRLPMLEHADQVVIVDGGRVRARGTWNEIRGLREVAA